MAMERQYELQSLSEHRAVSAFAHRGRILSFLRGRSFRGGRPIHDDRPLSVATRELGQFTESHPVATLRGDEVGSRTEDITNDQATNHSGSTGAQNSSADNEHFIDQVFCADNHRLENASGHHEIQTMFQSTEDQSVNVESTTVASSNDALQVQDDHFDQEHMHAYEAYSDTGSSEQSDSSSSSPSDNTARQEAEAYVQPPTGTEEAEEEWHVIDSLEAEAEWQPDLSRSARSTHNSLQEDELYGMYRVELRELLSRRSVSNLLSSGFRESLNQLINSYAQRQEHVPHVQHGIGGSNRVGVEHDAAATQPSSVLAGQTSVPQQRIVPPHRNWSRQPTHHPTEFELDDAIHDLRDDMAGLQRGMASTQQMLLACMEMQVEMQRSIRQEVSAALHRSVSSVQGAAGWMPDDDGSEWELVRKGTCCVCCDSQIDSLLYRCGHMCTCAKCAGEQLRGVGQCPLCRAPIVEVVRAYSVI